MYAFTISLLMFTSALKIDQVLPLQMDMMSLNEGFIMRIITVEAGRVIQNFKCYRNGSGLHGTDFNHLYLLRVVFTTTCLRSLKSQISVTSDNYLTPSASYDLAAYYEKPKDFRQ